MKDLYVVTEVAIAGGGIQYAYVPVPCRGNVNSVKMVYDAEMDADETTTVSRGATAVNLVTPTGALAAGNVVTGVPDTDNKALVFDPDSDTVVNRVLKIAFADEFDAAGTAALWIQFDDAAYVKADPSEV